jgi:hypothetical protein
VRRRDFITLLGGAAAAWPLAAQAQRPAQLVRRIGMLSGFAEDRLVESELLRTLSQLGWDNGRNVQIDLRWGAGNIDRIKMMAKELVASDPRRAICVGCGSGRASLITASPSNGFCRRSPSQNPGSRSGVDAKGNSFGIGEGGKSHMPPFRQVLPTKL